MVTGLAQSLAETGFPGTAELKDVVLEVLGEGKSAVGASALLRLKAHVWRLRIESGGRERSFVIKCMGPSTARRNELVARRWLPALGLETGCAALLGVASDPRGRRVWHVYEDLGDETLEQEPPDPERVGAAAELIARLHIHSAEHPMLAEVRQHGGDLGIGYFASNVRDGIRGLERLCQPAAEIERDHRDLCDRLLSRLYLLLQELPERTLLTEELGGPELMLHGDLWTTNTFVSSSADGPVARLIDWEHAGVGTASYDLSTFLYRFAATDRPWILQAYRDAAARLGWSLPGDGELDRLFDTAERARYANRVIWPAIALCRGQGDGWGFEELAEVDRWFEALEHQGARG